MKLLVPLLITGSLAINAHAATVFADIEGTLNKTMTQTFTQSVASNSLTTTFVYEQFNPSLGTLIGISLSIQESNDSGSFNVIASTNLRVRNPTDFITLTDNQGSGGGYIGSSTALVTTPGTTSIGHQILAGGNQTYALTEKSLIASTPVTKDLSGFLATYTGTGTVSFGAKITPQIQVTGGAGTQNLENWSNATKIALVYTYAVPEPSSALLGGLGVLALLRRRRA